MALPLQLTQITAIASLRTAREQPEPWPKPSTALALDPSILWVAQVSQVLMISNWPAWPIIIHSPQLKNLAFAIAVRVVMGGHGVHVEAQDWGLYITLIITWH